MTEKIVLDHFIISPDELTFIMAEIGINHGGLIDTFFKHRQQKRFGIISKIKSYIK